MDSLHPWLEKVIFRLVQETGLSLAQLLAQNKFSFIQDGKGYQIVILPKNDGYVQFVRKLRPLEKLWIIEGPGRQLYPDTRETINQIVLHVRDDQSRRNPDLESDFESFIEHTRDLRVLPIHNRLEMRQNSIEIDTLPHGPRFIRDYTYVVQYEGITYNFTIGSRFDHRSVRCPNLFYHLVNAELPNLSSLSKLPYARFKIQKILNEWFYSIMIAAGCNEQNSLYWFEKQQNYNPLDSQELPSQKLEEDYDAILPDQAEEYPDYRQDQNFLYDPDLNEEDVNELKYEREDLDQMENREMFSDENETDIAEDDAAEELDIKLENFHNDVRGIVGNMNRVRVPQPTLAQVLDGQTRRELSDEMEIQNVVRRSDEGYPVYRYPKPQRLYPVYRYPKPQRLYPVYDYSNGQRR